MARPRESDEVLEQLHARVSRRTSDEIEKRAESLGIRKSAYVRQILERWFADGCPPVSRVDEAVQKMEEIDKQSGEQTEE